MTPPLPEERSVRARAARERTTTRRGSHMATMAQGMERILKGETPQPEAARLIDMALTSYSAGEAVVVLRADERHGNPMGTVQGGLLAAMADAAMGWAYMTTLAEGESYTTLEMKINFLKPVRQGTLSARGRVRKAGRTVALVECDVMDDKDSVVAYAVSTCMTLRGEQAAGR
jgi:uncharacterized protein (TIGR00369 family)